MALPLRRSVSFKLVGAVSFLTVCFLVLHLHRPARWEVHDVITALQATKPSSSQQPVATPSSSSSFSMKPTPTNNAMPEKLWYKLGPAGLKDELKGYIESCTFKNPGFVSEFMTDASGDAFVQKHFASRPDMVETYLAITIPIIKADLLRYMILYEEGGIWNDLDVSCEAPIHEWVPEQYRAQANIVVGLEFDTDIWVRQFASWTIVAKPKSPHMLTVVEDGLEYLVAKARARGVLVRDLKLDMLDDIVDVSGPRRLTRGILKSVSKTLNREVGDRDISHVAEPRLIGDVLVLPDYAFADSMNQEHGDKKVGRKLTVHHYAGSWKNADGGEKASA
ncbi:glycosyltransferase family 32 protein [Apiospora kogelbergensis]|uniref:glycosyltransferase family 32 protein n=1 Tax=Apiospora kogelbergensis TaxID=1337665 RepID=UPI003131E5C9